MQFLSGHFFVYFCVFQLIVLVFTVVLQSQHIHQLCYFVSTPTGWWEPDVEIELISTWHTDILDLSGGLKHTKWMLMLLKYMSLWLHLYDYMWTLNRNEIQLNTVFNCYLFFFKKSLAFVNTTAASCSLRVRQTFGTVSHSYLSNSLISFPPAGCWMLMWHMKWAGKYQYHSTKYHRVNLYFSSAHRTANNCSSKFNFVIIKLTTISQHSNHTIMNFQKQLKPLSCGGTFMNTRKTAFSQPLITEHSSRGVTLALLFARNPFRRPQSGPLINTLTPDKN